MAVIRLTSTNTKEFNFCIRCGHKDKQSCRGVLNRILHTICRWVVSLIFFFGATQMNNVARGQKMNNSTVEDVRFRNDTKS